MREHRFEGFWRDVGTIPAYWACHQELVEDEPPIDLDDPAWPILTRAISNRASAHLCAGASIESSLIAPGASVAGTVERSVLGRGVVVESGAMVREAVLLPGASCARARRSSVRSSTTRSRWPAREVGEAGGQIALVGQRAVVEAGTELGGGARFPDVE